MDIIRLSLFVYCLKTLFSHCVTTTATNPCNLPKECEFKLLQMSYGTKNSIKCELVTNRRVFFNSNIFTQLNTCDLVNETGLLVSFFAKPWLSKTVLTEELLDFSNFLKFLNIFKKTSSLILLPLPNLNNTNNKLTTITLNLPAKIRFQFIEGFGIAPPLFKSYNLSFNTLQISIEIILSKFQFYLSDGQTLIESSCDTVSRISPPILLPLFQINRLADVHFNRCFFDIPICPLVFGNSKIEKLHITKMLKSFLKTNVLTFSHFNDLPIDLLNSTISRLSLFEAENINIDSSLLNKYVFMMMKSLFVEGQLNSIEIGVFKSFRMLKEIHLKSTREYIRRNGIEWMRSINDGIDVDIGRMVENSSLLRVGRPQIRKRAFKLIIETDLFNYKEENIYPDEDFCLYRDFPFNQLVIYIDAIFIGDYLEIELSKKVMQSCTFKWLAQFYSLYAKCFKYIDAADVSENMAMSHIFKKIFETSIYGNNSLDNTSISKCNFKNRLDICRNKAVMVSQRLKVEGNYLIESKVTLSYIYTILIFVLPVVLLFGLITNILVIGKIFMKIFLKVFFMNTG